MGHHTPAPTALFSASWPERLEACRGTPWQSAALASIEADARKAGDEQIADAAQYALDSDDLTELDYWFAFVDECERWQEMSRAYEMRTGQEAPYWMEPGW